LLQTFPADWKFSGGIESQSLQVGNAVPVKLGRALAKCLFQALADHEKLKETRRALAGGLAEEVAKVGQGLDGVELTSCGGTRAVIAC
jgi:hypothetical protein